MTGSFLCPSSLWLGVVVTVKGGTMVLPRSNLRHFGARLGPWDSFSHSTGRLCGNGTCALFGRRPLPNAKAANAERSWHFSGPSFCPNAVEQALEKGARSYSGFWPAVYCSYLTLLVDLRFAERMGEGQPGVLACRCVQPVTPGQSSMHVACMRTRNTLTRKHIW